MTTFDCLYQDCLRQILEHGIEELNQRTGHKTRTIPGMHFSIEGGFPLLSLRPIPARVFIAEQVWFLMGSRRPAEFLDKYTRIWREFTNLNGVVSTAYGYRWRHHFGRDQIGLLVRMLEKEPSSRHGVVMAWDPGDDGLSPAPRKKNVPCPILFTVNILGGRLHLHLMMRSNDMVVGCPFDVAGFALMQRILAARLGVGVGIYSHSISNAHIYDVHYEAAAELINRQGQADEIELAAAPDWFARAENADESLVDEIAALLAAQYHPGPAVGKLPVIL